DYRQLVCLNLIGEREKAGRQLERDPGTKIVCRRAVRPAKSLHPVVGVSIFPRGLVKDRAASADYGLRSQLVSNTQPRAEGAITCLVKAALPIPARAAAGELHRSENPSRGGVRESRVEGADIAIHFRLGVWHRI